MAVLTGDNEDNPIVGTELSDVIAGLEGNDLLEGLGGDDVIRGEEDDDTLAGGEGDDNLFGGEGDDDLFGGEGDDNLSGNEGDDIIVAGIGGDIARGDDGSDLISGDASNLEVSNGELVFLDNETEFDGEDLLFGNDGNDAIAGGGGDDVLDGGDGDDILFGGSGDDILISGFPARDPNTREFIGGDVLFGGTGDDLVQGGFGDDFLDGGPGNDQIITSSGSNTAFGGAGEDTIAGGFDPDNITGENGADTLRSSLGDDTISGDRNQEEGPDADGNDDIMASDGADLVNGGGGNDTISGGLGDDLLYGGDLELGNLFDVLLAPFGVPLSGGRALNELSALFGGDDAIAGDGGNDTLAGGFGADTLNGAGGGTAGDEQIDFLIGGLLTDIFVPAGQANAAVGADRFISLSVTAGPDGLPDSLLAGDGSPDIIPENDPALADLLGIGESVLVDAGIIPPDTGIVEFLLQNPTLNADTFVLGNEEGVFYGGGTGGATAVGPLVLTGLDDRAIIQDFENGVDRIQTPSPLQSLSLGTGSTLLGVQTDANVFEIVGEVQGLFDPVDPLGNPFAAGTFVSPPAA